MTGDSKTYSALPGSTDIGTWSVLKGKPWVTVSPLGIANGVGLNGGADFGPDTPGTQTGGWQEAVYTNFDVRGLKGNYGPYSVPVTISSNGQHVWGAPGSTLSIGNNTGFFYATGNAASLDLGHFLFVGDGSHSGDGIYLDWGGSGCSFHNLRAFNMSGGYVFHALPANGKTTGFYNLYDFFLSDTTGNSGAIFLEFGGGGSGSVNISDIIFNNTQRGVHINQNDVELSNVNGLSTAATALSLDASAATATNIDLNCTAGGSYALNVDGSSSGTVATITNATLYQSGCHINSASGRVILNGLSIYEPAADGILVDSAFAGQLSGTNVSVVDSNSGGVGSHYDLNINSSATGSIHLTNFDAESSATANVSCPAGYYLDILGGTLYDTNGIFTTYPHIVRAVKGFNPVGKIADPFGTGIIGLGGSGTAPSASTDYVVTGCDILITAADSANSNNAIVIKDPSGNTNGTSSHTLLNQSIPVGFKVNWGTFTGAAGAVVVMGQ
jgi:hypothetical protein